MRLISITFEKGAVVIDVVVQIFSAIIMALYVFIRGSSTVKTEVTEQGFRYVKHLDGGFLMLIECVQKRHTVCYSRWWIKNKTYYTYHVEIIRVKGNVSYGNVKRVYPHLCAKRLYATTYPHRLAVNACLDEITQGATS